MNLSFSKVLLTSLLVVSTTGLAFAKGYKGEANYKGEAMPAPCPPPVMLHDGFYVGVDAGYDIYRIRRDIFFNVNRFNNNNNFNFNNNFNTFEADPSISLRGWVGGIFVGYGRYLTDLFYLGGEAFGNYSGANEDFSINGLNYFYKTDFKVRGSWGLALLPGVRLNDTTLGYLRGGYTWTRFELDNNFNGNNFDRDRDHTEGGWAVGLGMESLLFDNWSLRTEYTYTDYNNFGRHDHNHVFANNNWNFNHDHHNRASASNNQFMLGLIYHFC